MKIDYSERAGRTLDDLASELRKAVYKQVRLLERNLRHPSLRAKKYDESINLWQARVNRDWRFYFSSAMTCTTSWISCLTRSDHRANGQRHRLIGSKKQAALQAAGPAKSESAGKIACPTSRAFS